MRQDASAIRAMRVGVDGVGPRARGLGAAIWSQLFLRAASSAGLLVIGSYLVELHDRGAGVTSTRWLK